MCGANRSHSNKTTSRKFRKSVDSVSGPRTELNIAAIVTSLSKGGCVVGREVKPKIVFGFRMLKPVSLVRS